LDNGKAAEVFARMVGALGGPADFVENHENYLQKSAIVRPVYAPHSGIVQSMDTRALGMAVVSMGGGRRSVSDSIDYTVGLSDIISLGEPASMEKPLAMIHAQNEKQFNEAQHIIQSAIICGTDSAQAQTQVYRHIRLPDIS
ncbi:MAG: thymidine phosphorylase, partial [Psychromonas sp.]